jgi:hypothetical protein
MRILKIFILLFSLTSGTENKEEEIEKRGPLEFLMNLNCQMMPGYLKKSYFLRTFILYFDGPFFVVVSKIVSGKWRATMRGCRSKRFSSANFFRR